MAAAVEAKDKRKLLQPVGLVQFMQHKGSYVTFPVQRHAGRPGECSWRPIMAVSGRRGRCCGLVALPLDTARGLLGPGPRKF
eukprot:354857-Chlamydomonas_euryale.AAC.57